MPLFPFGHGLSYTTFEIGEPTLSKDIYRPGEPLTVSVPVTNSGARAGSEVVQCYVSPLQRAGATPQGAQGLRQGVARGWETTTVDLVLEGRSFAYWDPGQDDWDDVQALLPAMFNLLSPPAERRERGWQVEAGRYDILIGRSSQDIAVSSTIHVPDDTSWR